MATNNNLSKESPFYSLLRKFSSFLKGSKALEDYNIVRLGTKYGGWNFVDEDYLYGCTIISTGLGEDASFDAEFAARYNAKVIIVDPAPRAIAHFNAMMDAFGSPASMPYSEGETQPIDAYNLSRITQDNLQLVKKALWNKNEKLKLYLPKIPLNVFHSITYYQNNYLKETNFIEVEAVTLDSLLSDLNIDSAKLHLIKLDIEGSEIEVLTHCLGVGILPRQILVSFNEVSASLSKGFERINRINYTLQTNGYKMLKADGKNCLYYR